MSLSFRVYNRDGTFKGSPNKGVREYQHEHIEGPFVASFSLISGEGDVTDTSLRAWFDSYLMCEFAAIYDGAEVWRGYIWEMQLELDGEMRVKSMEDMANAIKCRYTNGSGDVVHTAWQEHDESIELYGRRERVVTSSSENSDEATERAAAELQYNASPFTQAVAYVDTDANRLFVTCVGRQVAANSVQLLSDNDLQDRWGIDEPDATDPLYDLYQLDNGDDTTVGDEMRRIVEVVKENGGWLYALDMATNDTETAAGVSSNAGAFDRLVELAKLRDSDGNFYRLRLTNDGGVIYEQFSETVNYLRFPAPRGVEKRDGNKPMWDARPGIIKYVDVAAGAALPDTWLSDRRLSFAERTVMRDGDKVATFHHRDLDSTDIYRAIEANQRWIESRKSKPVSEKKQEEEEREKDIYGHYL
jgi:hypothetical protein